MNGLDAWRLWIGDLARPFAIIVTSLSASVATVVVAFKVDGFDGAGIFIGAVYAGVAGLYAGKAWENVRIGQKAAELETARVVAGAEAADDGELPPSERIG